MSRCEVCGNDYDKALLIEQGGEKHTFDSFECAIHALAPRCKSCGVRIVGHGLESDDEFFCSRPCAERSGVQGLRDHA
jgi:hypothetical protein